MELAKMDQQVNSSGPAISIERTRINYSSGPNSMFWADQTVRTSGPKSVVRASPVERSRRTIRMCQSSDPQMSLERSKDVTWAIQNIIFERSNQFFERSSQFFERSSQFFERSSLWAIQDGPISGPGVIWSDLGLITSRFRTEKPWYLSNGLEFRAETW